MATWGAKEDAFYGMGAGSTQNSIDTALLQEMLSLVNIVEVLERDYNILLEEEKNGWHNVCCPLPGHRDSTPSFGVNSETGIFNCFGCNRGGNLLRFIQIMDGCSFREALLRLSELSGIGAEGEGAGQTARTLRNIKSSTQEYLNRHAETDLPAGMSEPQFMRMLAERMRTWEEKTQSDGEEIDWIDGLYENADDLLWNQDQKGLAKLWSRVTKEMSGRKTAYRARQEAESGNASEKIGE